MKKEGQGFFPAPLIAGVVFCLLLSAFDSGGFAVFKRGTKGMEPYVKKEEGIPYGGFSETFLPEIRPKSSPLKEVYIRNDTAFTIDKDAILSRGIRVKKSDGVSVLIVHTHGTEAYSQTDGERYPESDLYRTTDETKNVIRVGEELKSALNARGISAVHLKELCDYPSYSGAYDRSAALIENALLKYPEATVVIDLHRDAVMTADGGYYRAAAEINGKQAAQIEFVCGTDEGGLSHPGWRDNLSFQMYLQQRLESRYPGLMRPLNLRRARFNQHFRRGSMLVEIGTCGNTLSEALYSARLFGDVLGQVLSE